MLYDLLLRDFVSRLTEMTSLMAPHRSIEYPNIAEHRVNHPRTSRKTTSSHMSRCWKTVETTNKQEDAFLSKISPGELETEWSGQKGDKQKFFHKENNKTGSARGMKGRGSLLCKLYVPREMSGIQFWIGGGGPLNLSFLLI